MELIKTALHGLTVSTESIKTDPAAEIAEPRATTPAAAALNAQQAEQGQTAGSVEEKKGVVMSGPLGLIFTRALNISYAKQDPATGEFVATADTSAPVGVAQGQAGEVSSMEEYALALESQANDWMRAAAALREKESRLVNAGIDSTSETNDGTDPDANSVPVTTSGTRAVQVTPDEVIAIFSKPDDLPLDRGSVGPMCDFIFYTDATAPTTHSPMGVDPRNGGEKMLFLGDGWRTSIESISIVVKTRTDKTD